MVLNTVTVTLETTTIVPARIIIVSNGKRLVFVAG